MKPTKSMQPPHPLPSFTGVHHSHSQPVIEQKKRFEIAGT